MAFKKIHHTKKSRIWLNWLGRIFMYTITGSIVLASFIFFWFAYMIYQDGAAIWGIVMSIGALILCIIGILFIRMVTRIPREDYSIVLKEEGIYQYFVNFDLQETKGHFISYDQIECIYLGPSAFKIVRKPYYFIMVAIVWKWKENGKTGYASLSVDNKKKLEEILSKFSSDTPIKTTDYNLAPYNNFALHEIFTTTELKDLKDRDSLRLPFKAFQTRYNPGPSWEPAPIREKRQRRYAKLDKYGTLFYRLSLIYCFLVSLFYIPNWSLNNGQFTEDALVVFPIPLMLPLMIFYYFREKFRIKQVLTQWAYLLTAYLLGSLIGSLFMGFDGSLLAAILDYGKNLLITLFFTFFICKALWLFFFFTINLFRLLIKETLKPNPRKRRADTLLRDTN
ncbi:hypothetical protein [Pradoshia sp.]